jgi:hypothetical protein
LSNDVPTTETTPRTESGRLAVAGGLGAFVAGTFVAGGAVFVTGDVVVSGAGWITGTAGAPAIMVESREPDSTFDPSLAHAMDAKPTTIERFLITFSLRAAVYAPRHCAEPGTACQLEPAG